MFLIFNLLIVILIDGYGTYYQNYESAKCTLIDHDSIRLWPHERRSVYFCDDRCSSIKYLKSSFFLLSRRFIC